MNTILMSLIMMTMTYEMPQRRNQQANWEKPSNVTSVALKTSRKNSTQQQSDCSVQDGPGYPLGKMVN